MFETIRRWLQDVRHAGHQLLVSSFFVLHMMPTAHCLTSGWRVDNELC